MTRRPHLRPATLLLVIAALVLGGWMLAATPSAVGGALTAVESDSAHALPATHAASATTQRRDLRPIFLLAAVAAGFAVVQSGTTQRRRPVLARVPARDPGRGPAPRRGPPLLD